jgi:hypothetical protein
MSVSDHSKLSTFHQQLPLDRLLPLDPLSVRATVSKAFDTLTDLHSLQESSVESRCLQAQHCLALADHFKELACQLCQTPRCELQQLNMPFKPMLTKPQDTLVPHNLNQPPFDKPSRKRKSHEFTPLFEPMLKIFFKISHILELPKVKPPPNPLPSGYQPDRHCLYNQSQGHSIDDCHNF